MLMIWTVHLFKILYLYRKLQSLYLLQKVALESA
uniref:Uncharacterized protein n=1 Tax=Siphoviridae sp. cteoh1 TaxID=2826407 RepID=A0A8S5QKH4_9CAUD|nr:MAG TPA: hypothetical protein [Siphoviridae sp. cteoh1]